MIEKQYEHILDGRYEAIKDKHTMKNLEDLESVAEELNRLSQRIKELESENKQLKAQLEKGEDVCSICKYEYLVASSEYYNAKCKKGHDECLKGDVDYCKDFELEDGGDEE